MNNGNARKIRSQSGTSVVELLVSTLLLTFSGLAIAELLYLNNKASQKVQNKIDSVQFARIAMNKIGKDVREGRSLGDVAGSDVGGVLAGSAHFPSNLNALYGNNGSPGSVPSPTSGWPANWSQPSVGSPWTVSAQTLIVQVPIFDYYGNSASPGGGTYGCPTEIPAGSSSSVPAPTGTPACNQANVETHVYQIVPDPDQTNHPNEFDLQLVRIPGYSISGIYNSANVEIGPQTLLTGIIGPMPPGVTASASGGPSGWPAVFSFIDKTGNGTPQAPPLPDTDIPNYTGVVINLEIKKGTTTATNKPEYLAVKQEVFMRNNALATTTGQPANITGDPSQWEGQ
jgi:hypothetical protein